MDNAMVRLCGDCAVTIEFENEISLETNKKVVLLKYRMEQEPVSGIRELVPSYRSLLIHYDPCAITYESLKEYVARCLKTAGSMDLPRPVVTEIPVLYEGEDMEEIAKLENKTEEEIIRIHSQSDYFVYMLGFAPGHPYTARFENPFSFKRRESPRVRIREGSIVVQQGLSNIIPFDQPCGWNIIGITPVKICDYRKDNPFLLKAGQWIRHIPVDRKEYEEIRHQTEAGTYRCRTYEREE
ncbi:allophanate hydrolase subunit 1 [Lachnospiraceae bacterium 54-53]